LKEIDKDIKNINQANTIISKDVAEKSHIVIALSTESPSLFIGAVADT